MKGVMRNLFLIFCLFYFSVQISFSQTESLQNIVISEGIRVKPKNEQHIGYGDFIIQRQLEYSVTDSTFRIRKNLSKPFQPLQIDTIPVFFSNPKTYIQLDSLFDNFTQVEFLLGKPKYYRVELVFASSKNQLPAKIKTMEFYMSMSPGRQQPEILGELVRQFRSICYSK